MNLNWNKEAWDRDYNWPQAGDEWSAGWGGAPLQWYGMLYRRVFLFLPTARLLEIATGFGRWTQFLLPLCDSYTGIDIAEKCATACQKRFADAKHATFIANDGLTIPLEAQSVDFAFSFDSLVHVDIATLESYVRELARVLAKDGVAFIHHSNLGAIDSYEVPRNMRHVRDPSVSAQLVNQAAEKHGLSCPSQEIMTWGREDPYPIDCISLFCRRDSRFARKTVTIQTDLGVERIGIRKLGLAYGPASLLPPAAPKKPA